MFIPLHDTNKLKHIKLQYVTLGILAVNILIWVISETRVLVDQEAVHAAITTFGFIPAIANGQMVAPLDAVTIPTSLTYFSYSFLHGDFMHLAGNMLFIWVFGDNVEDAMGHVRYFFFYFACAAAGAYAHSYMTPHSAAPLIGASGAVAGVIGAYLLLHPKVNVWILAMGRIPLKIPAMYVLGFWILFQFYQLATTPDSAVSFAAHIGGALAGIVLIIFLKRPDVKLFDQDIENKAQRNITTPSNVENFPKKRAVEQEQRQSEHIVPDKPAPKASRTRRTSVPSTKGKKSIWGRKADD